MLSRSLDLLVALAAALAGAAIAVHHPLLQPAPPLVFALYAAAVFVWPRLWLVAVPALLPILDLAPWTGWLTFEEADILVLATATGGYARCALSGNNEDPGRLSIAFKSLAAAIAISLAVSMGRGFVDAGGFSFGWFQGYDGPMNSVRIAKGFFLALLLVPLFRRLQARSESKAGRDLCLGLAAGLGTASLATLWERLAFTDLLNFSSDYRTTGLFWEMHVGGAALDGWLLLTVPFSFWALRNSRTTASWVAAASLLGLAAYACLTTFSRGVYLALPLALALLAWQLRKHQRPSSAGPALSTWGFRRWGAAIIWCMTLSALVFPTSGYRGLLALLGLIAVSMSMPAAWQQLPRRAMLAALLAGLLPAAALVVVADFLAKGPYLVYPLALAICLGCLWANRRKQRETMAVGAVVGFVCVAATAVNIARHWGGDPALAAFLGALAILVVTLVWATRPGKPWMPATLREQGTAFFMAVTVSGITAVFVGGDYMGDRFSSARQDLGGRAEHWRQAVAMLTTPADLALGKGLGRFPANFFFATPDSLAPGSYHLASDGDNHYVTLAAPRHPMSFGNILRVSQRLTTQPQGPLAVDLKVRTGTSVAIHLEICDKHLLYGSNCTFGRAPVQPAKGIWQAIHVQMASHTESNDSWYAPRFKVFSVALDTEGAVADVDDLALAGADGRNVLANGGFSGEMAHWFFSSDRDHLPWHAKNLFINVLFDQGITGLILFVALTLIALWRLSLGRSRQEEISPYLGSALLGILIVGIFDSLLDVPRLALLYYFIALLAVSRSRPRRTRSGRTRSAGAGGLQ